MGTMKLIDRRTSQGGDMQKASAQRKRGFTLVETLCGLLITVLVAGLVCTMTGLTQSTVEGIVSRSNSRVLLTTLVSSIQDELSYADHISVKDGKVVFRSRASGLGYDTSYVIYDANGNKVTTRGYLALESETGKRQLLEKQSYSNDSTASLDLTWNETSKFFKGTVKIYDASGQVIGTRSFSIAPMSL